MHMVSMLASLSPWMNHCHGFLCRLIVFLIVMANLCCGCRLNMHNTTMLKSPFVHSCCAPTALARPSLPSGQGLHLCPCIHHYLGSKVYTCCPGIVAKVYTSALIWPPLAHTEQCVAHLCCYILLLLLLLLLLLHTAATNLYFHTTTTSATRCPTILVCR